MNLHQLSLDVLQIMPPGATMKAKKGKKQDTIKSDLAHILGYTGTDMDPVGPPSPVGSEKDTVAAGNFKFMMLFCFFILLGCPLLAFVLLNICWWTHEGSAFVILLQTALYH